MRIEYRGKIDAAVFVSSQGRVQVQFGLRQQAGAHQRLQAPRDFEAGEAFAEFGQRLVEVALAAQARRVDHQFRLALLGAATLLLQGDVELQHQFPLGHALADLGRRDAEADVGIAVALHQVAPLLGAGDAGVVGCQLRIVGLQPALEFGHLQLRRWRQQAQLFGRTQREVFRASQQRTYPGCGLLALAFEHDQIRLHGDDLGLRAQGILLAAEAAGVAGARYLGDAPHQVEVFLRVTDADQMHMVLGVGQLDAGGQFDPAGTCARLRLVGAGTGHVAAQVALAEPGHRLAEDVARAADPRRQQVRAGVLAFVGDVAQLGTEHRVGQGPSRFDTLRRRRRLGAQRGEFGMAAAGEFEQALDLAADQLPGRLGAGACGGEQHDRRKQGKT